VQPIGYVGNAKNGSSPFGTVCDLRVYPYLIKKSTLEVLSNYHPDLEFEMPDKYSCNFIEMGLINFILSDIVNYRRPQIICNLLRILRYLSNH
jgi:hypothetical protein